jgi:hypothetical protein
MNFRAVRADQELTDLLVDYDAGLAAGKLHDWQFDRRLRLTSKDLRARFDRARDCLLLIERTWPRRAKSISIHAPFTRSP